MAGEKHEGSTEGCATAVYQPDIREIKWKSRDCTDMRPYLCMGHSGVVMSRECKLNLYRGKQNVSQVSCNIKEGRICSNPKYRVTYSALNVYSHITIKM